MKEITIRVKIEGDKILSILDHTGFPDGISGRLEIIGILENLKIVELDKIRTKLSTSVDVDEMDDEDRKSYLL